MRKTGFLFLCLLFTFLAAEARHIAGGELSYTHTGIVNGNYQYVVTLKLYRNCEAEREFDDPEIISVFDKATNNRVADYTVSLARHETNSLTEPNPCITNPPMVCLDIAYYTFTLSLPGSADGYLLATQVNFRAESMNNLVTGYGQVGATYTAEIPGTSAGPNGPANSSALFVGSDLEVLCTGNRFSYSFAARDKDGDALRYSFCNAYTSSGRGGEAGPATTPPYSSIPYGNSFTGATPLGGAIQINQASGLITGTAPQTGTYVIAVCVEEIRNGVVIATQRKDIQVRTSACTLAAAALLPQYTLCKESYRTNIANISTSTLINSYEWILTDSKGTVVFTSTASIFDYTFADTGSYRLNLVVGTSNGCADSTTSSILVYPGFKPGFVFTGSCYQTPFQFTDTSKTPYGTVASWLWDFGDAATADVVAVSDPSYHYGTTGSYTASLIVATDKGCTDTISKAITVSDKPLLQLSFTDTLICSIDTLQLQATGNGNLSWTPNATISNVHTATPQVYPKKTTTYVVTLTEQACVAQDSVTVNVLDFVTVQLPADTLICEGDSFQLHPVSKALQYQWTPAIDLNDPNIKSPVVSPHTTTTYHVTAGLGKCQAEASTSVKVSPYPRVAAGSDTVICHGSSVQLHGATTATAFAWLPVSNLVNASTLQPRATPLQTTTYVLSATDASGCPKPAYDTVMVTVLPQVVAFAGNDTNMVAGQPLQLQATGGESYQWLPATGLSSSTVADPIVTPGGTDASITYKVTASIQGCSDADSITIHLFKTGADILVPTAFTPNADGRNDVITPIPVGMKNLDYFRVYNRWGQLVFNTIGAGKGWDGTLYGVAQSIGTFVFMAQGIDYNGRKIFKKGTFVLIR